MKTSSPYMPSRRRLLQWMALAPAAFPLLSRAEAYPSRPVRIILPYAAGGSTDVVTRLLAQKLGQRMGQQFIVDNKPGASGNIGLEQMIRSPADGYTLAVVPDSNMTINPHFFPDMRFDPIRDTSPVATLTTIGVGLVVNHAVPITTVEEFIAYSHRTPAGISYATPGTGTPHHLAAELLKQQTGANLTHVAYKGGAPAIQDVVAGHVPAGFVALAITTPHVESGKLRLIAVTQGQRASMFPSTPTIGETVRGFDVTSWMGLFAPAGTPVDVLERLNREITSVLNEPDVKSLLAAQALEVITGTREALSGRMETESARWEALIGSQNIKTQ